MDWKEFKGIFELYIGEKNREELDGLIEIMKVEIQLEEAKWRMLKEKTVSCGMLFEL